jgi:Skp family chaperone for outer membrane proteins
MKKILLMTMVLLALNFATSAQEKKSAVLKYYDTELLDEIGATADQKAKVAALVKEFQPQLTEVNKDASLRGESCKIF